MTLRIELERLWKRLQTRFKARRKTDTDIDDPEHPILLETVQPITNFDELAKIPVASRVARDISAGAGATVAYFTVPQGERWTLKFFYKEGTTANTQTRVNIDGQDANISVLGTTNAAQALYDLVLEEGDFIGLRTTGDVGDNARTCDLIYVKEDAF